MAAMCAATFILATVSVTGQAVTDRFDYPASTSIPNWSTEFGADWGIRSGELLGDYRFGWQFLVRDSIQDVDCAVENTVRYDAPSHLQFCGTIARATLSNNVLRTYMAKIQDNYKYGSGSFNRAYLYYYESPLGMLRLSFAEVAASTVVRTRLVLVDEGGFVRVMGYWDVNMDGVWDTRLTAFDKARFQVAGGVGVNGFSQNLSDDWKYWDAVLYERNAAPLPGETLELVGRSQPGALYIAASSLLNTGFPLDGKTVPLFPDPLMVMSMNVPEVFQNFVGVFDSSGDTVLKIAIPSDSALVGVVFYTAFVSLTTTTPNRVLEVSNDVQVRIGG